MVTVYGNSISSGFTDGISVEAIYTYGCQVWPSEESWTGPWPGPEIHYGDFYVSWTPVDVSGDFFGGKLEDYSGYYILDSNYIPSEGFRSAEIKTVETTALRLSTNAFRNCTVLETASLPHCSKIGGSAFRNCFSLSSLSAPECTLISTTAFYDCSALSVINLPKVTTIESYAFYNTSGKTIILPECSYIGAAAFLGGASYKLVTLGYQGVVDGFGAFGFNTIYSLRGPAWLEKSYKDSGWFEKMTGYPDVFNYNGFHYLSCPGYYSSYISGGTLHSSDFSSVSDITSITTDATGVGSNCFVNSSVKEVYLWHCIEIFNAAFRNCYNLETVIVPEIQYVRSTAFEGCSSLTNINLSTCLFIGSNAFSGCISLNTIRVASNTTLQASNAFQGCNNLTSILVPAGYLSSYKTASNWSYFSDIIYPYR